MSELGASGLKLSRGIRSLARAQITHARNRILGLLGSANIQRQWLLNISLLIAGLGLGQGTIFAVQTALVAAGEYRLLSAFGVHYSFAILTILMIDAGGSTILARMVAHQPHGQAPGDDVWQAFCEMSAIRLVIACLIGTAAVVYAFGFAPDGFSRWYVALALPGMLLWAVNAVGLLDGQRMSGVSGITGSAAYLVTAVGLAFAAHRSPAAAGGILGGAFSAGYLMTLVAQWVVLGRMGWFPRYRKPTRDGLVASARDGVALLFQLVPGQVNMRVQLVLSAAYLGAETTALFIYAKQVVTALTQIIGFVLRVEFPGLVKKFATPGKRTVTGIVKAQKTTLYLATAFATVAAALSGIAALIPGFRLHQAAFVVMLFAPTIWTTSISLMINQGLAAMAAYAVSARALVLSSAVGILACYLLISPFQVYALVASELIFHLTGFYIVYRYLRNTPDRNI
jgi:O-antigen/teichoic acid export membrane protein